MPLSPATPANITTGDPYSESFTMTVNGVAIASSTLVQAALITKAKDEVLIPATDCTFAANKWTASFSAVQTRQLLSEPLDLSSKFVRSLLKNLNQSGYAIAWLEIQIGTPYFLTRHTQVTIGKGLIE